MSTTILNNEMNKKKVPQLRFQEFNTEWTVRNLGDFIKNRKLIATPEAPLYSLTIENGIIPKSKRYERSFLVKGNESAYKLMLPDDFAYNPMNLRFGALAKHKGDVNVAVSKYYDIFYCNGLCDSNYLEYYLTSFNMIQFYNKMATGTLEEKKRVHYLDFIHFKKLFPTLLEQQKIASFLNAVNEKIQQLTRKATLLEHYKKGVMQQLFSGKLRFKEENGRDYPDWKVKKLGEVSTKKSSNISANKIEENFGDFIIYGASGVLKKVDFYKEENDYISIIKDGAGVGRLLYCKGKSSVLGTMEIISPKQNIDTYFLYCLLSNIDFVKYITGSTIPHIYFKDYSKESCGIPSLKEQQKIANFLSGIDSKIEMVNQQLAQTQTFKKGLLQQMFV